MHMNTALINRITGSGAGLIKERECVDKREWRKKIISPRRHEGINFVFLRVLLVFVVTLKEFKLVSVTIIQQ